MFTVGPAVRTTLGRTVTDITTNVAIKVEAEVYTGEAELKLRPASCASCNNS